jgi:hypothetical protein
MICPECNKEFEAHRWNIKYCSEQCRSDASNRRNYSKNKSKELKRMRDRRMRLKIEVLTHYSPNGVLGCSWEDCKINDVDMLSLDHVNNDGAKDRKENPGPSTSVYFKVKQRGFPLGLQTLCWNHQWKKELTRSRDVWEG